MITLQICLQGDAAAGPTSPTSPLPPSAHNAAMPAGSMQGAGTSSSSGASSSTPASQVAHGSSRLRNSSTAHDAVVGAGSNGSSSSGMSVSVSGLSQDGASDGIPKLFVVANGHGGPCLDLSRVPNTLAEATLGVDLLVIEGMGRSIHTNLTTEFKCDCLKLAMIKTERLARKLFGGSLYDCVCMYQAAASATPPSVAAPPAAMSDTDTS